MNPDGKTEADVRAKLQALREWYAGMRSVAQPTVAGMTSAFAALTRKRQSSENALSEQVEQFLTPDRQADASSDDGRVRSILTVLAQLTSVDKEIANWLVASGSVTRSAADAKLHEKARLENDFREALGSLVSGSDDLADARVSLARNVPVIIGDIGVLDKEIAEWRPDGANLDGDALEELRAKRQVLVEALRSSIDLLLAEVDDLVLEACRIVTNENTPGRFSPFRSTIENIRTQSAEEASRERAVAVENIRETRCIYPDAIKEINRLLNHTSVARIEEEMDVNMYLSQATRLFERIESEFSEASQLIEKPILAVVAFAKRVEALENVVNLLRQVPIVGSYPPTKMLTERYAIVRAFFNRYKQFLEDTQRRTEAVERRFCSKRSVAAYKNAVQSMAVRIEKEGLFQSWRTLLAGALSGLAVGIVIVFLSGNFALKNMAFELTALAASLGYGASVLIGKIARRQQMRFIRWELSTRLWTMLGGSGRDRARFWVSHSESSLPFDFPPRPWESFDQKTNSAGAPLASKSRGLGNAPALDNVSRGSWRRWEQLVFGANALVILLVAGVVLLASVWPSGFRLLAPYDFVAQTTDQGRCVLATGHVLFGTGDSYYLSNQTDRFVAEVPKSAVLLVRPSQDKGKGQPAVALASAGQAFPAAVSGLPDCSDAPVAGPKEPLTIALAAPIDLAGLPQAASAIERAMNNGAEIVARPVDRRLGELVDRVATAPHTLVDAVGGGLQAIAEKLSPGGEIQAPCVDGCPPITLNVPNPLTVTMEPPLLKTLADHGKIIGEAIGDVSSAIREKQVGACTDNCAKIDVAVSPAPVVVPVLVEAPAFAPPPEVRVDGPTFITQILGSSGDVEDVSVAGDRRMLLLPLFPEPVTADPRIDTPDAAYRWAFGNITDPEVSAGDPSNPRGSVTLLARIGKALRSCVAGSPETIALRVEGFATSKWDAIPKPENPDKLNWYLAEGRRHAIIEKLGLLDEPRIVVENAPRRRPSGNDFPIEGTDIVKGFQFGGYEEMRAALSSWIVQATKDDARKAADLDIFSRSVVVSWDSNALARCGESRGATVAPDISAQ